MAGCSMTYSTTCSECQAWEVMQRMISLIERKKNSLKVFA